MVTTHHHTISLQIVVRHFRVETALASHPPTTLNIPITVGSLKELSFADEMEKIVTDLYHANNSDQQIAEHLNTREFRSPMKDHVLISTVQSIRLKHGLLRKQSQSHARHVDGFYTVPQIAKLIDVARHWIYDRINNGTINVKKDQQTSLFLFPRKRDTIAKFKKLKSANLYNLDFLQEYQDE